MMVFYSILRSPLYPEVDIFFYRISMPALAGFVVCAPFVVLCDLLPYFTIKLIPLLFSLCFRSTPHGTADGFICTE
jgi:hypothetical protein